MAFSSLRDIFSFIIDRVSFKISSCDGECMVTTTLFPSQLFGRSTPDDVPTVLVFFIIVVCMYYNVL